MSKKEQMIRAVLQASENEGLVRWRAEPTAADRRSHYLHISLYAGVFLSVWLLG